VEKLNLNIDELFRKRFENFEPEPPVHIWSNVSKNITRGPSGSGITKIILLSGISLLTISLLVLLLLNPFGNRNHEIGSRAGIPQNDLLAQVNTDLNLENSPETEVGYDNTEINRGTTTVQKTSVQETIVTKPTGNVTPLNKAGLLLYHIRSYSPKPLIFTPASLDIVPGSEIITPGLMPQTTGLYQLINSHTMPGPGKISINTYNRSVGDEESPVKKSGHYFKLGAFINPEVVFYPSDSVDNSRNFNFGLSLSYHKNDFFIRSGLGISIARDEGKYQVEYKRLEYLGSYEEVYHVSFDSTESGIVPIFYTKTVNVYDSVEHVAISKTKNTYTYLQIPLLIGYQFEKKHLTWSFMAGPSVSFLISKNIPDPEIPNNVGIIGIDRNIAQRIETNWQMVAGIGLNYRLNHRLEFAVEPTIRYYLNSSYNREIITTKHPVAFGLRAGLLFKF